nr:MAG TPA: hypothetical protein [Caudoviricetes sp.]
MKVVPSPYWGVVVIGNGSDSKSEIPSSNLGALT